MEDRGGGWVGGGLGGGGRTRSQAAGSDRRGRIATAEVMGESRDGRRKTRGACGARRAAYSGHGEVQRRAGAGPGSAGPGPWGAEALEHSLRAAAGISRPRKCVASDGRQSSRHPSLLVGVILVGVPRCRRRRDIPSLIPALVSPPITLSRAGCKETRRPGRGRCRAGRPTGT
jgi:hypothetical protein